MITNLLKEADKKKLKVIAIPAIGTGRLQFPKDNVAKIIVDCVCNYSQKTSIEKVLLVAFNADTEMINAFQDALNSPKSKGADQGNLRKAPSSSSFPLDEEDMAFKLDDVLAEIICGDLTKESSDAIVVLGNQNIDFMGAVGNAIRNAEGEEFMKQVQFKRPQRPGTTKLFKTTKLRSKYIAHVYPKSYAYDDLKSAIEQMFIKCSSKELSSVSLPAIGTGVIGKTPEESAKLILDSFVDLSLKEKVSSIKHLKIVLFEEKHVAAFKKKFREIVKNPEDSLENKGVIAWIKAKVKIITSIFSRYSDKNTTDVFSSKVKDQYHYKPLSPIVLNVYFFSNTPVLKEVREKMTKFFDDHIISSEIKKEMYKALPSALFRKIKTFARQHDVMVELDKNAGIMKVFFFLFLFFFFFFIYQY